MLILLFLLLKDKRKQQKQRHVHTEKGEIMQSVNDYAMGVYPFDRRNKEKLLGCEFIEQTECEELNAKIFVFQDKYRKLNIDLFFMSNGELFIGDYYGATMKREEMSFVILRGKR